MALKAEEANELHEEINVTCDLYYHKTKINRISNLSLPLTGKGEGDGVYYEK